MKIILFTFRRLVTFDDRKTSNKILFVGYFHKNKTLSLGNCVRIICQYSGDFLFWFLFSKPSHMLEFEPVIHQHEAYYYLVN